MFTSRTGLRVSRDLLNKALPTGMAMKASNSSTGYFDQLTSVGSRDFAHLVDLATACWESAWRSRTKTRRTP